MANEGNGVVNLGYRPVRNDSTALIARAVLQQLVGDRLDCWDCLQAVINVRSLRAGEYLFRQDVQHPYVYFVRCGIIKMVYETEDGKEWIKSFAAENAFFASLTALQGGSSSFASYAIIDTCVEQLPYKALLELADQHTGWQKALRRAFEIYGFKKETREKELLVLSPEERYKCFLRQHGALADRLSDKDVAGYIRVTPVALSRIKRRLRLQAETALPR